jgi:hypothetical protein
MASTATFSMLFTTATVHHRYHSIATNAAPPPTLEGK